MVRIAVNPDYQGVKLQQLDLVMFEVNLSELDVTRRGPCPPPPDGLRLQGAAAAADVLRGEVPHRGRELRGRPRGDHLRQQRGEPELQSGTGSLWWRAGRRRLVKQRQKLKGHRTNQSRCCSFREKPSVLLLECETLMSGITARIWSSRLDQSPQLPVSRPRLLPQQLLLSHLIRRERKLTQSAIQRYTHHVDVMLLCFCAAQAVSLLEEVITPRKELPPLLLKLSERRAERLDYLGVSYGLTNQLLKYDCYTCTEVTTQDVSLKV